jgi:SLT domain-containing protein
MNESSGNPDAVNNWDSNAAAGTPSIGLMQVIQPTFDAYALPGYDDIYNPVDNIIAAAIYAQDTYGGLDNVVADRCGGACWSGY